jgi:hypothetical protein
VVSDTTQLAYLVGQCVIVTFVVRSGQSGIHVVDNC